MRPNRSVSPPAVAVSPPDSRPWPVSLVFLLLLVSCLAAYYPALTGELLWDDEGHVTRPDLQSWSGLFRIWFEVGATQQYYPLLHSAFWIEHAIWGDATLGYHLVNVLWHATAACLLAVLLRRLALRGALLAAFVFALHPVCVESVAWISEQKNTLSTVFYLAAALAWLRFEEDRKPSRYAIATLWFVAALLTKSVTATLPAALLVVAWWRRGRLSWRNDVAPLLLWFVLGVAAGLGTVWFESEQIGAKGDDFALSVLERGLLAGRVIWFYLGKLVWPAELTFFYPRWTIDAAEAWQWVYPVTALAVLAAFFIWSRRNRAPLVAALLFGGTLVPVLGFVNVYPFVFSYVADHFQYLASLGMIAFLTAAATQAGSRLPGPRWGAPTLAAMVLLGLGTLTWRQSGMYRDPTTLYETTLARNPDSWVARLNLGTTLADSGRVHESLPHLRRALELKPNSPEVLNSLGDALNRLNRPQDALPLLQRAVQLQPGFAAAYNTLGASLLASGRGEEGIAAFKRSLELQPDHVLVRVNLGWALANQGRVAESIVHYEQVLRQQPDLADAEFKWGLTYALHARIREALPHLARAVELQPDHPDMRHAYGRALMELGKRSEAITQFQEALALNPDHPGARDGLNTLRTTR
jgi:tetratricopeptide (TPR) repeat protein